MKLGLVACLRQIMREHGLLHLGRHIAPRILEQRNQIVGAVSDQRILEIEQALLFEPAQQHDVFGMIIAQHADPVALAREHRRERCLPRRVPAGGIDAQPLRRAPPFDEQPRLAHILGQTIGGERPRRQFVQLDQRLNRIAIDLGLVGGPRVEILAHPRFAEVLDQH